MDNLAVGNVYKKLILYSLPLVCANLLIAIINIVDVSVVGKYFGETYSIGVGIASQLNYLTTSVAIGCATGISIIVAKLVGENNYSEIKNVTVAASVIFGICALLAMLLQFFLTDWLLSLLHTPQAALTIAKNYSKLFVAAIPFLFMFNMIIGIVRGLGDSIKPMLAILLYAILNVGGSYLAVGVLKTSYLGTQYVNIGALVTLCIFSIIYLCIKMKALCKKSKLLLSGKMFWHIIKVSAPVALINMVASISFMMLTGLANRIATSEAEKNINILAIKYNGFAVLPVRGLESGVSAVVAQSVGADAKNRVKKTAFCGLLCAIGIGAIFAAISLIIPDKVLSLLGASANVAAEGRVFMRIISADCLLTPLYVILFGVVEGRGKTTVTMIISVISVLAIRIGCAYLLQKIGIISIAIAVPLASLFSFVCVLGYAIYQKIKKKGTAQ